jgi:uncharacterized membrane protein
VEFEVTREDIRIAWLTALALGMYVLEMAFPSPLPSLMSAALVFGLLNGIIARSTTQVLLAK